MAVKAAGSVTVASINDVASTTRYYLLQSSTLTAPAKPTANPPGGSWAATEPTYSEGSTNSLYTCDQTVFSDGTWAYSAVSLSTSYEASKTAYNKAVAVAAASAATDNHFWWDAGGAHVSSTGDHDTSGFHQLMTSVKNAFMHGSTELMTISENLIELGKNSTSAVIEFCGGLASIVSKTVTWQDKSTHLVTDIHSQYGTGLSCDTNGTAAGEPFKAHMGVQTKIGWTNDTYGVCEMAGGTLLLTDPSITDGEATVCVPMKTLIKVLAAADGVPFDRLATAIQPVVLYNGGAALDYDTAPGEGTTGTVTLSETAAHFAELLVTYKTDDNAWDTRSVVFPDGKNVDLGPNHPADRGQAGTVFVKSAFYAISGTTMTCTAYINTGVGAGRAYVVPGDVITVMRVTGRR